MLTGGIGLAFLVALNGVLHSVLTDGSGREFLEAFDGVLHTVSGVGNILVCPDVIVTWVETTGS
jgi:hypothetical protein